MYRRATLKILPKWHFWNNRVYFSNARLKENFQKNLEVIRNCNKVQKFCGILINAKEVIQEPLCLHLPICLHGPEVSLNKNELHAHSIIYKLKKFIHKDKPEYTLIDTILETIDNSSVEARQKLISLLFSIETVNFFNQKSPSSRSYLKRFINDVECFIKNHGNLDSSSQEDLKTLETELLFRSKKDVINVINSVDEANFDEGHHSDDHYAETEALVSDAASLIYTRLLQLNTASKSLKEKNLFARRSSYSMDRDDCLLESSYLNAIGDCFRFLEKVPIYYMTRKERLLQYLKDTKSSSNACEIFVLLRSTQKLRAISGKSLNSDLIVNRLKDIIHTEKPEFIMKKFILMSLRYHTHYFKEISEFISQFFLDVDNFDCGTQNSENFLKLFIQEFTCLLDIYANDYKSSLALDRILFNLGYFKESCTANLLKAVLRKYQTDFCDEEKKRIGFLMVEAITPIEKYVNGNIEPCLIKSPLLKQRSALQYFQDFFDSFPVEETPLKCFDKNRIEMCIQKLDDCIESMCENTKMEAELEDREENELFNKNEDDFIDEDDFLYDLGDHDDLQEHGASTMPESHVWWAKCSETLNKIRISRFLDQLCNSS